MKKSTNLIFYLGGCYGTFIEWVCTYFAEKNKSLNAPFTTNGSSHDFLGNPLMPREAFFNYLESNNDFLFARTHPYLFTNLITRDQYSIIFHDLVCVGKHFNQVVVIHPSVTTKLWYENSRYQKVNITTNLYYSKFEPLGYTADQLKWSLLTDFNEKIKLSLQLDFGDSIAAHWGKKSVYELELWELRELMSIYWFAEGRDQGKLTCWQQLKDNFTQIKFISLDTLRENTVQTIVDILEFFSISNYSVEEIQDIISDWKPLQIHMNKDTDVDAIVNSLIDKTEYCWKDVSLTILDEAFIQYNLRLLGINIKCFNLNQFPTSTQEFFSLLEYTQ